MDSLQPTDKGIASDSGYDRLNARVDTVAWPTVHYYQTTMVRDESIGQLQTWQPWRYQNEHFSYKG